MACGEGVDQMLLLKLVLRVSTWRVVVGVAGEEAEKVWEGEGEVV